MDVPKAFTASCQNAIGFMDAVNVFQILWIQFKQRQGRTNVVQSCFHVLVQLMHIHKIVLSFNSVVPSCVSLYM